MKTQPRPLESGFELEYATQVIGVDSLFGGDVGKPEGAAHFIADTYPKGEVQLPPIHTDKRAEALRKAGGANQNNVDNVRGLINDYGLLEADNRLEESLPSEASPQRTRFATNMGKCLSIIARTAMAIAEKADLPPFNDRFRAATAGRDPVLVETKGLREQLRAALSSAGLEVSTSRGLRETVQEWERKVGNVLPERFAEEVANVNRKLLQRTRNRIFRGIDFGFDGHDSNLEDIPFDGLIFKTVSGVSYTGSSAYEGGVDDEGRPALRDLIEYNIDHPVTNPGLWHLISHEMTPGHYIDSAAADLGWRSGKLGFEAAAHTMCTTEIALREGWAQNALAMLFGGDEQKVIEALGKDHAVEYVLQRLQDAGKVNGSLLFQGLKRSIEDVKRHLEVDCVLSDAYVKKLSGAWAKHPIFGPMYGPAYQMGYEVVKAAIQKHGPSKVAEAALHQHGYCDIETFGMVLEK